MSSTYIVMISCPSVSYFLLLGDPDAIFHKNANIDLTEKLDAHSPLDQLLQSAFNIHFGRPAKLLYRMACV